VKVAVDADRCEGHGLCEERAPAVFALDDDGRVTHRFRGADVPAEHEAETRAAVSVCPVAALRAL
jgi:ferredoxin